MKKGCEIFLFVFLILVYASCEAEQKIGKWDLFELSIKGEKFYDNPFKDVQLIGEFVHSESKRTFKVYGFYDGGFIWKIRFMPDEEGGWSYKIYFSDSPNKPVEGKFVCVPSKIKGPLRVYPKNKIWLSYADGTPFYMFAFCLSMVDSLPDLNVLDETLDFVRSYGFNTIVGPHIGISEIPGVSYRAPWVNTGEGFDFSRYDLHFWRNMDIVILALKKRNMFLIPFSIFGGTNGVPRTPRDEWESFIRYWTARWAGFYNVTFQPTSEWEEGFKAEEVMEILQLIRKYDPWKRLISVHSWDYSKRAPQICRSLAYDYFTLQDKLTDWDYGRYRDVMEEMRKVAEKPILAHECIWEGNIYQKEAGLDVDNLRRGSWTILLSGAYLAYEDDVEPPRKIGRGGGPPMFSTWGALMKPAGLLYPHLKFMFQVFSSIPWWNMRPYYEIEGGKNVASMASVDKSNFIVYFPEGGEAEIKGVSGRFEVRYIDPLAFKEIKREEYNVKGEKIRLLSEKEMIYILKKR